MKAAKHKRIGELNRGKTRDAAAKKRMSDAWKQVPNIECPHCGVAMKPGHIYRWHFDNCKLA